MTNVFTFHSKKLGNSLLFLFFLLLSSTSFGQFSATLIDNQPGELDPTSLICLNGELFFEGEDANGDEHLYKLNANNMVEMVHPINPTPGSGSNLQNLFVFNNLIFFSGDGSTSNNELWVSDGTNAGTMQVLEINPTGPGSPTQFTVCNGKLYFKARIGDQTGGGQERELWTTDGTAAGTVIVQDQNGNLDFDPTELTCVGTTLFFEGEDANDDEHLYKLDAGSSTIDLVSLIDPTPGSGTNLQNLTAYNGKLYFSGELGTSNSELWVSDGTDAGTFELKEIAPLIGGILGNGSPGNFEICNGLLYFSGKIGTGSDGNSERELWVTDGTAAGTVLIEDRNGDLSFDPRNLTCVGTTLFFEGEDINEDEHLYKLVAGSSTIELVDLIDPAPNSGSNITNFFEWNGMLVFSGETGTNNKEVWVSDGTDAGTFEIQDINPSGSSSPSQFAECNGRLFFQADDGTNGEELWEVTGNIQACNTPPMAMCNDLPVSLVGATATITVAQIDNGSTAPCGLQSTSIDITSLNCSNVGSPMTVTLTVTDINNASATCTGIVTVTDDTDPTAICQDVIVVLDADGNGSTSAAAIDNGSNDACGIESMSLDITDFTCANIGNNTVTLTVTDNNGNSNSNSILSNCTANVDVQDNTPAIVNCDDITIVLDPNGVGNSYNTIEDDALFAPIAGSGTSISLSDDQVSGALAIGFDFNFYGDSYTELYLSSNGFVTFGSGQGSGCCSGPSIPSASGNNNFIAFAWEDLNPNLGGIIDYYTIGTTPNRTFILNFTDIPFFGNSGNVTTQLQLKEGSNRIEIHTTSLQSNNRETMTVGIENSDGTAGLAQDGFNGSSLFSSSPFKVNEFVAFTPTNFNYFSFSDNCIASTVLPQDLTAYTCVDIGPNAYSLSITDVSNVVSTCTGTVTIVDNLTPVVICKDIPSLSLDETGNVSINTAQIDNGSFDNCAINLSLDISTFDCTNVGVNNVVLTASDDEGNSADCNATITIIDNNLNGQITEGTSSLLIDYTGSSCGVGDGCDANIPDVGTTFSCSDNPVSNFSSFTFTDPTPPGVIVTGIEVELFAGCSTSTGSYSINGTLIETLPADLTDCDCSCPLLPTTFTLNSPGGIANFVNGGDNTLEFAAPNDGNGFICGYYANLTLTYISILTEAECQTVTTTLDVNGSATVSALDVDNGTTDNCGIASYVLDKDIFDCADIGTNNVVLTVTDVNGNVATCNAVVTVEDNTALSAICPTSAPTVTLDATGSAILTADALIGNSIGNCSTTETSPLTNFTCADVGTQLVTLTVSDGINTDTQDCNVTVEQGTAISINTIETTDENCLGASDGTITIDATSGSTLEYSINGTDYQPSNVFTNVAPDTYTVTVRVENENGCIQSSTTTVNAGVSCDPEIADPCSCLNNASPININTGTGGDDGTFSETVSVSNATGLPLSAGLIFTVIAPTTGVLDAFNVPAIGSQSPGMAVATDGTVTMSYNAISGSYELPFVHLDNIGYSITIEGPQAVGTPGNVMLSISNKCAYPNPVFSTALDDLYCPNAAAVMLGANEPNGADMVTFTIDGNPATSFDPTTLSLGSHIVEMTYDGAADANGGNSPDGGTTAAFTGCIQTVVHTIEVNDTEVPVAICPTTAPVVVLDDNGNGILAENALAGDNSTDNCSVTETSPLTNYTCADVGTQMVTLTVTDNTTTPVTINCNVTVEDNVLPDALCQDAIAVLDVNGNASIVVADIDNGSDDACGIQSLSLDIMDFTCAEVGDNTVTLTVIDNNGNEETCTATVDVQDNTPPMLICQDITIPLDVNGLASITPAQIDNGSNDACGIASLSLDNQDFTCATVGDNSVTLTATDVNGNSDTCTQTVSVEDNVPPVVLTQDITVELDNEGNVTITPAQVDNGSNDACDIASLALNLTEFNCGNVGPNVVILTATDVNGNPNTETAIVNVVDLIPAEITCRQPISTTNTPGVCGRNDLTVLPPFVLYDNCGIDSGIDISRTPDINDFPIGTTVLTWTVTDSNGNPATCESLVIIEDTEAPTVGSCNTVIDFLQEGTCMAQVTVSVEAADNCGVPTVEGAGTFMLPLGIHPRTITITDENGNVTLHEITIYVHDDQSPELVFCPENIEFFTNGSSLVVDLPQPIFTDNCEIFSLTNDAPEEFEEGNTEVTFTASDTYGNWVNCTYEVSIISNLAFVDIIDEIEASTPTDESASLVNWNGMQARSNCETCAATDYPEYIFLGDFNGHQYFLYNGAVSWSEAANLSEDIDGHLVTINDERENEFLEHQLPNFGPDAGELFFWTGLNDSNIDIEWQNGDAFEYLNFPYDLVLQPDVINAAVLNENGTWTMTTGDNENSFIVERPCIDFTQTGPMVLEVSEEGDSTTTLLTPNTEWAIGEYVVTYEADDMCGNTATYSFDVIVDEANADYCSTGSTNHDVWLHEVTINDYFSGTGNNEGYADFTEEVISLEANNPITVQVYPVGLDITPTDKPLFTRIWADLNNDGDFFDDNEMVFETLSNEAAIAEFPYPTITEDTEIRIRVAVAEFQYPEVCADFTQGEAEDYLLFLPYVEERQEDTRGSSRVNTYPNPADEYVIVDLSDYAGQKATIRILDRLGKVQQTAKIDAATEEYRIDLQKFVDGMYFLEISTDGRRNLTQKLVINKLYGWRPAR